METTTLVILIFLTFVFWLTGFGTANKRARLALIPLGLVSYMSAIFYQRSIEKILETPLFFVWLQAALYGAILPALLLLRVQGGKLIFMTEDITWNLRRYSLVLLIPLTFFLYPTIQSTLINISINPPQLIFNEEFFYQGLPYWVVAVSIIGLMFFISLSKAGVHERAVIFLSSYIEWSDITSFSAYELNGRDRIAIRYKAFPLWKKTASMILVVPKDKKQMLREILLAKNIPEENQITQQ